MPFDIRNFKILPLTDNRFIRPVRLNYLRNGKKHSWEAVQSHDAVSVLLYHRGRDTFVLVKQFRAPVYMNHPQFNYTYELCAGLVDKDAPRNEIARDEILEECGYEVELGNIREITSFFTNVGTAGNRQTLYYAAIDEEMKVGSGGGIHNEEILIEHIPVSEAQSFLMDPHSAKTPGLMFAFYWFLHEIRPTL